MSKITSIATAVPQNKHIQKELFAFAEKYYAADETEARKLKFLYRQSGIEHRYSVVPDYCENGAEKVFFTGESGDEFPGLERRMKIYDREAPLLSATAITNCIEGKIRPDEITHLITVSCTGMSAPGLDLQLVEALNLKNNVVRTSINFMGCYAAIHGLKMADAFCRSSPGANVVVVCTELCSIHFQKEITPDNITSSLIFADGSAAALIQHDGTGKGLKLLDFYAEISLNGKKDMAWELSSQGFLMTLSGFIPDLIKADFNELVGRALAHAGKTKAAVTQWCIHPGGKKILESVSESLGLQQHDLQNSYVVLNDYGNMSSPTVLFVLCRIFEKLKSAAKADDEIIFGAAFGPGLTMETFTATYD